MSAIRRFIIRTPEDAAQVVQYLRINAGPAAKSGRPLQAIFSRYSATRSNEQNSYMWAAVLQPTAEQVVVSGRHVDPETWNVYLKQKFLPETCAKGIDKWEHMPDGSRVLRMSTTDLNVEEMRAYLDEIQAHVVTEFGVHLPADPNH